ncbi:hypothetical protein [Marininema halotolerans]|uniref:Uncharacterized protein n=1 Tax=Marininema halotolerans TaxID=1155944 RepID=A0A1I6SYU8_9BACL|nr:hypothetical protein [Marininema halotolerans]SFS82154.1 hypothetical protein SAMN05444972_108141 [Marininema halotolerans]
MDIFDVISKFGFVFVIGVFYVLRLIIKLASSGEDERAKQQRKRMNRRKKPASMMQGQPSNEDPFGQQGSTPLSEREYSQESRSQLHKPRNNMATSTRRTKRRPSRDLTQNLTPKGLKQAIVLKEILDPPLARRRGKRLPR